MKAILIIMSIIVFALGISAMILSICASITRRENNNLKLKELPLGKIVIREGHRLVVQEDKDFCKGCYFIKYCKGDNNDKEKAIKLAGPCMSDMRKDGRNVKFIEMK